MTSSTTDTYGPSLPPSTVNRELVCPTALDVVVCSRFPDTRRNITDEKREFKREGGDFARFIVRIYVWTDSTLAEVGAQLAKIVPVCRVRGCRVVYGVKHAGKRRAIIHKCGYTRTDGIGVYDNKTLERCGYHPGDSLCVAVQRWSFRQEHRCRLRVNGPHIEPAKEEEKQKEDKQEGEWVV